jgi:hypothetical protein
MIVALAALFIALGGTAVGALTSSEQQQLNQQFGHLSKLVKKSSSEDEAAQVLQRLEDVQGQVEQLRIDQAQKVLPAIEENRDLLISARHLLISLCAGQYVHQSDMYTHDDRSRPFLFFGLSWWTVCNDALREPEP